MPNTTPLISFRSANWAVWAAVLAMPLGIAILAFKLYEWDLSVPMVYHKNDDLWQLILTKSVLDNGWFLNNPFLGAPGTATGHFNSAAQSSSLHSIIMKLIGVFVSDAVKVQYLYYFLNFSLISLTSYLSCRLLGVSRLFAVAIGILFSFSLLRLNLPLFAFISNYFMVPLAIAVVVWCAKGEYTSDEPRNFRSTLADLMRSKKFGLSFPIIVMTAISDGYYAFFTALLLGLAAALVFFHRDHQRLANSLVPLMFAGLIISTALLVMTPLTQYKSANRDEFFPGGVQDPSLTIHPFEAEVYASSLKVIVTPNLNHRVSWIARVAKEMHESGVAARKHGHSVTGQVGSLGSLGFFFLMLLFLRPKWIVENKFVNASSGALRPTEAGTVLYMLAVIAAFIFVCSTMGGLGSLIAFFYPFIRAYERFSIFLLFVVLLAIGFFLTHAFSAKLKKSPLAWAAVAIAVAVFLLDQIPVNLARSLDLPHAKRFLAEREFVRDIEHSLSPGDMVYQYPYAQYMALSPYYGMGSQAQTRSYLHSRSLRWSNGASKNSRVDLWHRNLATFTADELSQELAVYGFKGILIDRWVVKKDEFDLVVGAAKSIGAGNPVENATAEMAFIKLPDYGFHLTMSDDFRLPQKLHIHQNVSLDYARIPPYINGEELRRILESGKLSSESLSFADHPDLLNRKSYIALNTGIDGDIRKEELLGDVECAAQSNSQLTGAASEIHLVLKNNSKTPWRLNSGVKPITLGWHVIDSNGKIVTWDNGARFKGGNLLEPGKNQSVSIKVSDLQLRELDPVGHRVVFELLQEQHTWFGVNPQNKVCTASISAVS
jgi:hypothetical protein